MSVRVSNGQVYGDFEHTIHVMHVLKPTFHNDTITKYSKFQKYAKTHIDMTDCHEDNTIRTVLK